MTYAKENTKVKAGIRARTLGMARARVVLVAVATLTTAIPASAQNPFAFLFGGSPAPQVRQAPPSEARWFPGPDPRSMAMREGRSAYAPGPGPDRSAGLPGYREWSEPRPFRPRPHAVSLEPVHSSKSPKEVMAAIEAVKPGHGPLGPFVNDPTLRAGDVVVTTKGLMVFRGAGGHTHSERDFVSLSNASGLVPGSRQTLISLESANRMGPQGTASAEPKLPRPNASEVVSAADPKSRSAAR